MPQARLESMTTARIEGGAKDASGGAGVACHETPGTGGAARSFQTRSPVHDARQRFPSASVHLRRGPGLIRVCDPAPLAVVPRPPRRLSLRLEAAEGAEAEEGCGQFLRPRLNLRNR